VNPTFTGTATGLLPADGILVFYLSSALPSTPRGTYGPESTYAIVPMLADPLGRLPHYQVTSSNGGLDIVESSSSSGSTGGGGDGGSGCGLGSGVALLSLAGVMWLRRRGRGVTPGR